VKADALLLGNYHFIAYNIATKNLFERTLENSPLVGYLENKSNLGILFSHFKTLYLFSSFLCDGTKKSVELRVISEKT